jgi:hypothetical protein
MINPMDSSEYDDAVIANKEGRIHDWTLDFLEGPGNNASLARVLREKGQYHFGPVDFPLKELRPILGPDETFKFYEAQTDIDSRVAAMSQSFSEGWKPAPIIATDLWEDYFTVADGAHRYELLKGLDIPTYPTIFYFRSEESLNKFKARVLKR